MSVSQDVEVRSWLDRLAIQDLIFQYSNVLTRGDYDQMAGLFAPDAIWESPLLGLHFDSASAFIQMNIEGSDYLNV